MCGGIGSRFWPYSRHDRPKQFIDFFGTGRSLLQMSFDRIAPLVPKENVIVVTNEAYAPLVEQQLPELSKSNILLEPERRNTAPCIAWAARHIMALDPDSSMIVAPSDHIITRENIFQQCITRGFEFVENHHALLTLGIKPSRPETGYGYIQVGNSSYTGAPGDAPILKVKTFTEKPDIELARVFLESGEFFWNSGIFLWKTSTILDAFASLAPDLHQVFEAGTALYATTSEQAFIDRAFPTCPGISIDYAIMEKADNVYVECADFGWNDLGTWGALYDISPKNRDGNVTQGCNVVSADTSGSIFASADPDKLIVARGLHDYIIADSGDVLLIYPKADEQKIKQVVNDVEQRFASRYL
ncbi:MAG: mannose-1-phosphate guanylyltransferase [Alloprevotella sp.]|nr:mannose-1-phosphate guanylyltransferase [Alloprevotella sp.]